MDPTPPPEGWTLREAAEALCPEAARLHAEGGEALEAAERASMGEWAGMFDLAPDLWLATRLLESLAARPDLRLTGRDLAQGITAPRFTVPGDVLRIAATTTGRTRVYLDLDLARDAARISYSFEAARPDLPSDVELMAVRVEAIRVQADAPRTVTRAPEPPRTWLRGNAGISTTERAKWTAPPSPPTTALPDPRRNPWLSVDEALCWIAFRECPQPDDETARADRLDAAERDLVAAAAAGRIPAKGEEGTRDSPHPGVMPGTIPPDAFAKHEAGLSILKGGRLGLRHRAPISAILEYAGPYFHHVRFDAAAILAEWPAAAPSLSATEPPPGGWTLAEAAAALLPDLYAPASQPPPANWWMAGGAETHKQERDALRLAFARLMEAGKYAADGIALNEAEPSRIPPHLWRMATFALGLPGEPHYPAEVMAGGRWWRGVRVTRAATMNAAAPPPKLSDMPARWTLLEALAWIVFRDTSSVQAASLEMPREATAYWAEARLPGGNAELVPVMGEPGSGRLRLSAEWAYDRAQGTPPNGLAPDAAENDLLAKLRSGAIVARGRLTTDATPRAMDPGDWRGLALVERTRGDVAAEPQGATGKPWREISVARDDVVREWPPCGQATDTAPTAARPAAEAEPAARANHWMQKNVTRAGQRKREAALAECRSATGCTYREALAAWTALPPDVKGTRGRPGKAAD